VNNVESDKEDIVQDFVSVITSFCARIYGQRRSKRNTEKLVQELANDSEK
jgi:predicted site-specific integrase-resolvase